MAIAIGESVLRAGSATTLDCTLSVATEGQLLVAIHAISSVATPTISGSGWTRIVNLLSGVSARIQVWWKVAGASEPTTITFTNGVTVDNSGAVLRYTGAHATAPYVNDSDGTSGSDATVEPGTAGGSGADYLLAAFYTTDAGISVNDPGTYSVIDSVASNGTLYLLDKQDTSSDAPTFELDVTPTVWVAANMAFDAAAGFGGMNRHLQNLGAR